MRRRVLAVVHSDGTRETYAYRADSELVEASSDAVSVNFEREQPRTGPSPSPSLPAVGRRAGARAGGGWEAQRSRAGAKSSLAIENRT